MNTLSTLVEYGFIMVAGFSVLFILAISILIIHNAISRLNIQMRNEKAQEDEYNRILQEMRDEENQSNLDE